MSTPQSHVHPPTKTLRPSQCAAFERLRNADLGILNAPTGWGKSLLLNGLVADDLKDSGRKAVIAIPQRIISKGFVQEVDLVLPTGHEVHWRVENDLCVRSPDKVKKLVDFLTTPASGSPAERIIVVTHMTLACAFGAIEEGQRAAGFHKTTLVVDEAHHVHSSDKAFNRLGSALDFILNLNDPTVRILLATVRPRATPSTWARTRRSSRRR